MVRQNLFINGVVLNDETRLKIYQPGSGDKIIDEPMTAHQVVKLFEQLWPAVTKAVCERERTTPRLVIVESPFAGDIERNTEYARACISDSLSRGEAPFASHLLYTQAGILDDAVPEERRKGIDAGLAWGRAADLTAVYTDLGVSLGMEEGIKAAERAGRTVVRRSIK